MGAALLVPTSASAATFYVRSSADSAAGSCPANDFANSTACTCRSAWNAANANPGSDTIELSVDCPLTLIGIDDSNAAGDLDAWDSNSGTTLTVELDGHVITWASAVAPGDRDRLLHVPEATIFTRPVHLIVRGGELLSGHVDNQTDGGGCVATRLNLVLDSVNVEGCRLIRQSYDLHAPCGGAVEARGALTVTDSSLIQNDATNANGGGICAYAGATVTRTVFDGNRTLTDGNGGAFALVRPPATAAFEFIEIEDSVSAQQGGGLWSIGEKVTIIDSEIRFNVARYGAGIWLRVPSSQGSDPLLERSLLWANHANAGPGPRHGGGLYVEGGSTTATLVLYNSTLSRNEADNDGGAMFLAPGGASYDVELRRCTVFENADSFGIDNVSYVSSGSPAVSLSYTGSLLAGACPGGGTTTTLAENLIANVSLGQCDFGAGELVTGPFALNSTLSLGNGGFARYHDINAFSAAWGGATCSSGEVDQANAARSVTCDVGAVEEF